MQNLSKLFDSSFGSTLKKPIGTTSEEVKYIRYKQAMKESGGRRAFHEALKWQGLAPRRIVE